MSSLSHHGVEGQRWGVRRYQNKDGTRTALGKRRDFERRASKVVEDTSNSPQPFVRRPFNKDKIRQRGLITQAEADQCAGLAAGVFKQASQAEPKITSDVIDVVSSTSAKMYGLDYRLKQPTSIAAKIGADAKADGITFEQAAGGLKDVIRYTAISDSRDYADTYNAIKQRLEEKGYTETKCKNYFQKYQNGEVMHKAVQSTFRSPDGVEFEVQFQTPESQAAKELKVPIYNERRKAGNTPERNAELEQEMRNLAEQVPDPEGVFGIESHSGVKNMKHSSMTGDGMIVVDGTLYLEHSGKKGMKWGVRNYQNYDGSLTPLGRIHYGYGPARSKAASTVNTALKKTGQAAGIVTNAFKEARQAAAAASEERRERKLEKKKEKASKDRSSVLRNRNLFTTKELEDLEKRFTAEDKLRANVPDKKVLRKAAADQKAAEKLAERKEKASQTRAGVLKNKKLFTNEELKALSERFNTEDKIKQESIDKGLAVVKNLANAAQSVQTIVGVFEDVSGVNISPIKRAQAEQKKAWDLEDRQRKQHFEDTKEAREEGKYKRETETWNKDQKRLDEKDKRDIEAWKRDQKRQDAKEQRDIEQVEYNRKRDRVKDQRERAERLIKKRNDAEDRNRKLAREDAEDRRKAAEEIRKIKKEAAEERRKAITAKNVTRKQKAEARLAEIKAIEAAMGLSNNKDLSDFEEWLRTIDPTWARHDSFDSDYIIQNGVLLVNPEGSSLAHHGIKRQRWGVRRFQNYDGSLTPAGRERYGVGPEAGYRASINEDAIRASGHKYYDNKYPEKGHNPKDSENAADKRRDEIAKELEKMGFKITENMTAEEHEAATAKILDKPYTEKKPLTAEDFRQIPDRYNVEAMSDKEKKDLEDKRAADKAEYEKQVRDTMIGAMSSTYSVEEIAKKLGISESAVRSVQEERNKQAADDRKKTIDAELYKAANYDSWQLDFLETVQNDWFADSGRGDKKTMYEEYKKYLDDPRGYMSTHHADEDPPSVPKQRNVWDAASKITTTPETETKMSYTKDEQKQRLADAEKNGRYDITFAEATVYWGDDKGSKSNLDSEYKRYLTNPRKYLEDQANQNKERQRRVMEARVRQMSGKYTAEEIAEKLGVSESTVRTMQGANPTFLAERGLSRPRKYQNPDGSLTEAGKKKFEEGKVLRTLSFPSDYRHQPGYKKKVKHSSLESNYIIQNGVLMINPAERR